MITKIKNKILVALTKEHPVYMYHFGKVCLEALNEDEFKYLQDMDTNQGEEFVNALLAECAVATGLYKATMINGKTLIEVRN